MRLKNSPKRQSIKQVKVPTETTWQSALWNEAENNPPKRQSIKQVKVPTETTLQSALWNEAENNPQNVNQSSKEKYPQKPPGWTIRYNVNQSPKEKYLHHMRKVFNNPHYEMGRKIPQNGNQSSKDK